MRVGIFVGICSAKPWHSPACGRSGRSQPLRLLKQRSFPASLLSDVDGANERLPGIPESAASEIGKEIGVETGQRCAWIGNEMVPMRYLVQNGTNQLSESRLVTY